MPILAQKAQVSLVQNQLILIRMKQILHFRKIKQLSILFALSFFVLFSAQAKFEKDDILYFQNIDDGYSFLADDEVCYHGVEENSGITILSIPSTVTKSGVTYTVVAVDFTSATHNPFSAVKTYHSASLTQITIPNTVIYISDNFSFRHCTALEYVNLPAGVLFSTYDNNRPAYISFRDLSNLKTVVDLSDDANFENCTDLENVNFSAAYADEEMPHFRDCSSLASIEFPNSIRSIGNFIFNNCSSLTSVTLNNGLEEINLWCFEGCTALTQLNIPTSVSNINPEHGVPPSLQQFNVSILNSNYSAVDGVLYNKLGNTLILYPAGKTGNFTIPNNVTSLGNYAFTDCSIPHLVSHLTITDDMAENFSGTIHTPWATTPTISGNRQVNFFPKVDTPASDVAGIINEEITVNVSSVFEDVENDVISITASIGTVTKSTNVYTWKYTPTELSSTPQQVVLTGSDSYGSALSSFYITQVTPPVLTGDITFNNVVPPTYNGQIYTTVSNTNNTGTLLYQWKRNGVNISGATNYDYVPVAADIDKTLSIEITGTENDGSITATAGVVERQDCQLPPPGAPGIVYVTDTRAKLSAPMYYENITLEYSIGEYGYNWQSSSEFTGLTPSTQYTAHCRVKQTSTEKASAAGTAALLATLSEPHTPILLRVTDAHSNINAGMAGVYIEIYGDNGDTFGTTDANGELQVILPNGTYTIYYEKSGYNDYTTTGHEFTGSSIIVQEKLYQPYVGDLSINHDGTPQVGEELSINLTNDNHEDGGVDIVWYRGTTEINGSTSSTYTLVDDDLNNTIKVQLVSSRQGTLTSDPTPVVTAASANALTGTVTISGTLQYGEELTVAVSETNNTGTLSYQWKRDGSSISGASSSSYTLSESDITKSISVDVTSSVETGIISSVGTAAIEKADKAAPVAPSLASKTHNSITLTAVEGCEYYESMELGTRQSSPEFTNLVANTGYDFQQRYVETATHKTSPWSGITSIATDEEPINALTGTVTISGTLQYGEELTAAVSETNNTGTLSYQWKRDGSSISGASSSSYTLSESDISKSISVDVTSSVETGTISSVGTAAIEKADKAAPVAPSLASKTHNSITLTAVEGCEYYESMELGTRQSSPEFTNLVANTGYDFQQRYVETATHKTSPWSGITSIATDEEPINALTGTVTISGTLQYGEELTAAVSETNNTGTLSYQWKRDGSSISGASSSSYTLSESDITKSISVDVTSSVETGTISSAGTAAIEKADKAAPAAPSLASKTHNSITLTAVEGCEYYESLELGTRQSSPEFTNLVANTGYDFQQRYVETATHKTSPWSGITSIATDEEPINALTGTVTISGTLQYGEELTAAVSETNNTGTLSYQWKRDGSSISGASSSSYTLSESDISKSISVDVTSSVETGTISSVGTAAIEKADKAAPAAPSLASKTHNSITLTAVEGCEYYESLELGTRQSSPEFTNLVANTGYDFQQRYVETATHKTSPWSGITSIATDEEPINALTGTVTISGTLQYGEELTAAVSETNNTGTLSYQWKRDGSSISGASSSSYTLSESDISKSISVDVTSSVETGTISSVGTAAIEKADKAAPAIPILASKTHNSITLNVVEGCEYAIDAGTWQSSVEFTGLSAATSYSLTQRYAETATHKASAASSVLNVETETAPANALTGTVTISGTLQYGEELTAAVSETNNTGTLSYQWKRDGLSISGASSSSYTLVESDISKSISVEVNSSVESGSISSTGTAAIEKADKAAPAAPTLASKTHNSITLNVVEGCEYAIDAGTWQSSVEFTGLSAATSYSLTQRYAETATHKASAASSVLNVETETAPANALTGTVTISGTLQYGEELTAAVSETNNTGTLSYQWKRDGSSISGASSSSYTLIESDISKSISVEVNSSVETGSISSVGTSAIEKADQATPAIPTLASKTHNSITLNVVEGCEYAIDAGTWQSSVEFTGLSAATSYSLTQRYAETATHKASAASEMLMVTTDEEPAETHSVTFNISGEAKSLINLIVVFDGTEYSVNDNGTLVIENIEPGTYNYSITAQGFIEHASSVTIEDQDVNLDVVLKLVTAIDDLNKVNIKAYPNPAANYIVVSGVSEGEDLMLFDVVGNKVIHKKVQSTKEQLDLSSISSGIYFVKTGDKTIKIIVER